ncbi:hypothetical protein CRENBAI_016793 [Crenichthys baileyi]|uniref:Uncharacterized protein n=1 Tax=Crenichthys baileyi TaxID=28760 RepID=A0AAV9SI15_9TELE
MTWTELQQLSGDMTWTELQQLSGDMTWAAKQQQQRSGDLTWAAQQRQQRSGDLTWAAQQQQQRSGDLTWAPQQQQQRSGDLTWAAQQQRSCGLVWKVRACLLQPSRELAGKPPAVNPCMSAIPAAGGRWRLSCQYGSRRGTSELRQRDRAALPNSLALGCLTLHLFQQQWRGQHLQVGRQIPHRLLLLMFHPTIQGVVLLLVREVQVWRKHSVKACEIEPQNADEQAA